MKERKCEPREPSLPWRDKHENLLLGICSCLLRLWKDCFANYRYHQVLSCSTDQAYIIHALEAYTYII